LRRFAQIAEAIISDRFSTALKNLCNLCKSVDQRSSDVQPNLRKC
jgi:hypothetical protein